MDTWTHRMVWYGCLIAVIGCQDATKPLRVRSPITPDVDSALATKLVLLRMIPVAQTRDELDLLILIKNASSSLEELPRRPGRFSVSFATQRDSDILTIPPFAGGSLSESHLPPVVLGSGEVFGFYLEIPIPEGVRPEGLTLTLAYKGFALSGKLEVRNESK